MDPTSLPTDNLYKFMALSGLGIAGFCLWFWWTRWQQFRSQLLDLKQSNVRTNLQLTSVKEDHEENAAIHEAQKAELFAVVAEIDEIQKQLPAAASGSMVDVHQLKVRAGDLQNRVEMLRDALPVMEKALDKGDALASALDAQMVEVAVQLTAVEADKGLLMTLKWAMAGGGAVGLVISVVGFAGWYLNVQRYADQQTEADFRDHMAELAAKREARAETAKAKKPASKP